MKVCIKLLITSCSQLSWQGQNQQHIVGFKGTSLYTSKGLCLQKKLTNKQKQKNKQKKQFQIDKKVHYLIEHIQKRIKS